MESRFLPFFCCVLFIGLAGCQKNSEIQKFIFLGHPYAWTEEGNRLDPRIEKIPFHTFDQVWLGGDVCGKLTENEATLDYLDSLLHLGSEKVHWTLGNHDVKFGHEDWITARTRRPTFYSSFYKGFGVVVLNTLLFSYPDGDLKPGICDTLDMQMDMLRSVKDSLNRISHLFVLHHYGLLTDQLAEGATDMRMTFNFYHPEFLVSCRPEGTFETSMYPLLVEIQKKGTQVIMVGGDLGMRAKEFQYRTKEGIWFLGSGINNSVDRNHMPSYVKTTAPDKILVFEYDLKKRELTWTFPLLNPYVGLQPEL